MTAPWKHGWNKKLTITLPLLYLEQTRCFYKELLLLHLWHLLSRGCIAYIFSCAALNLGHMSLTHRGLVHWIRSFSRFTTTTRWLESKPSFVPLFSNIYPFSNCFEEQFIRSALPEGLYKSWINPRQKEKRKYQPQIKVITAPLRLLIITFFMTLEI